MSALILASHVKKGMELAKQHKLGPEITDIIQQHHGTSLIAYFHNKALEQARNRDETVREEDYRYPGPKPQTKEAGIVMLADAIEASSRTLIEPTPSRIKGHIQGIMRKIFSDGELDESMLTLRDMHVLGEAFHKILTGIFHQRISYPAQQRDSKDQREGKDQRESKDQREGKDQRLRQQGRAGSVSASPLRGSVAAAGSGVGNSISPDADDAEDAPLHREPLQ